MTPEQEEAMCDGMLCILRWINVHARAEKPDGYEDKTRPARVDAVLKASTASYKRISAAFRRSE